MAFEVLFYISSHFGLPYFNININSVPTNDRPFYYKVIMRMVSIHEMSEIKCADDPLHPTHFRTAHCVASNRLKYRLYDLDSS